MADANLSFADDYNATSSVLCPQTEIQSDSVRNLLDHLAKTSFVVQRVFCPLIAFFGIVGNLISIAVLTRRWMRSSTNYYLTALAVCDTMYLIFASTMTAAAYDRVQSSPIYRNYQYPIGKPLVDIFSNTGVWLTLTFTVERWLCVCHPMRGRIWCTPQRAIYIIVLVCIAAVLITSPEFFEYLNPCSFSSGICSCQPEKRAFAKSNAFVYGYVTANQILFTFLPLILLAVFNSLLIRAVFRAAYNRKSMLECRQQRDSTSGRTERMQREQQKVTVTLISVVLVFLFCHTPQGIQNIYLYVSDENNQEQITKFYITANIFNMLVMINASVNFVLYSTFNTKFRRTFKRISIRTYKRLQGRVRVDRQRQLGQCDTSSPYRDQVTSTTKMTKLTSRSTESNLHKCVVVKSDLHVERCGVSAQASPVSVLKVSGTLNSGQYLLTPTCNHRSPNLSMESIKSLK